MEQSPVDAQPCQRYRAEMNEEIDIADLRDRTDEHVLRVAGDRGDTADVRGRRKRQQIRQRLERQTTRDSDDERGHHETNDVVHQESGQDATHEYHGGQQLLRAQPQNRAVRDPLEKAAEVQVGDDQRHGEQQHDGREINGPQRFRRSHDAECHHQHRADDGRTRPVDLQARELPQGEDEIAGKENRVGRGAASLGEQRRSYLHPECTVIACVPTPASWRRASVAW